MRTKNFVKTAKKLSCHKTIEREVNKNNRELDQHIEDRKRYFLEMQYQPISSENWRPIPERTPDGMELLAEAIKQAQENYQEIRGCRVTWAGESTPLPPIPPTYTGMRPPILLTASQAEQIVEMGGELENVIITDRLPPIPESCQVPTMNMPCSYGGYVQDDPMTTQIYLKSYPKIFETSEARQKMHNCPYFANSPHLKCTANPTNTNCLECEAY